MGVSLPSKKTNTHISVKTEHILIIRFSAMGDVAMTVPVVQSLAKQYPELRITFLSRPFARPLFEGLAPNVGFMGADIKKEYHGVGGLNKLYKRIVAKNITAVADLHNVLRSGYLRLRFNLGRYRVEHIDKHRNERKKLVAQTDKRLVPLPTAFQNYADVFAKLGYPVKMDFTSIFPPQGGNLRLLPAEIGVKKAFQEWIGVAPFAAHKQKVYPPEMLEKVIKKIIREHPSCRVFLFGKGPDEDPILNGIVERNAQCLNASAVLGGIAQELVLMSHLDVMISMDSANMHFASLVNTPVVSIWGATHPYAGFMGWGQKPHNAVQIDLACRPCSIFGNKPCLRGDLACLRTISPEMVYERVKRVLSKR